MRSRCRSMFDVRFYRSLWFSICTICFYRCRGYFFYHFTVYKQNKNFACLPYHYNEAFVTQVQSTYHNHTLQLCTHTHMQAYESIHTCYAPFDLFSLMLKFRRRIRLFPNMFRNSHHTIKHMISFPFALFLSTLDWPCRAAESVEGVTNYTICIAGFQCSKTKKKTKMNW